MGGDEGELHQQHEDPRAWDLKITGGGRRRGGGGNLMAPNKDTAIIRMPAQLSMIMFRKTTELCKSPG